MKIDRDLWSESFYTEEWPKWPCPQCREKSLQPVKESFKSHELASSIEFHHHEDWDCNWYSGAFHSELKCINSGCGETVYVTGEKKIKLTIEDSSDFGDVEIERETIYPKYCYPALHLFDIPENTPWDIESAIINAFALFWSDKSACGNSIRKVVELILNDKRVGKMRKTKAGKWIYLKLDERIKKFEIKNKDAADTLMAIKWIGNVGSHEIDTDEEVLFDGLELLEFVLEDLYGEAHHKRMASIRKRVIKRKGK